MLRVVFIEYPLSKENRAVELEIVLQNLEKSGSSILHITSDNEGYTVVYREGKQKLNS
jgi:hypothetical protein